MSKMSGDGWTGPNARADPDFQIRRRGVGVGVGSKKKRLFRPFGPQFGLKIRGGGWAIRDPPLDLPLKCS